LVLVLGDWKKSSGKLENKFGRIRNLVIFALPNKKGVKKRVL
jgi:hypothetical protein